MKKISRFLISTFLVVTMLFSFGCASEAVNPVSNKPNPNKVNKITFQGIHNMTAPEVATEDYIVKDGNFEYQLVVPQVQDPREAMAIEEFKLLLKRAVGNVPVSVVTDDAINEFDPNMQYISIGNTKLLELSGIEVDRDLLGYSGVQIVTIGKTIFLIGGNYYGICNAVYDFYQICFNFEIYMKNCIEIDTGVKNLKLRNFDVLDIPDIQLASVTHGPLGSYRNLPSETDYQALLDGDLTRDDVSRDVYYAMTRMRLDGNHTNCIGHTLTGQSPHGSTYSGCHTTTLIFSEPNRKAPGNENIVLEKDFFASSGMQICWTAHGDPEKFELMTDWCANYFIHRYKSYPKSTHPALDYIPLCNEDGAGYCECDACLKSMEDHGGAYSAMTFIFGNRVIEKIEAAMNEALLEDPNADWVRPNFKILMFAYGKAAEPPAYYDEEAGKYVTYNDLVLDERICIWNTTYPIAFTNNYDIDQKYKMDNLAAWGDIASCQWSWHYSHHYNSGAYFLDNLNGFNSERMQHMAYYGYTHNFAEVHSVQEVITTWFNLTTYFLSKYSWDSTLDEYELATNFFNAYFGPAADTMMKLYFNQKTYCQHMQEIHENKTGGVMELGFGMWTKEHYPYQILKSWVNLTDQALLDIEIYKTIDPDMYEVYRDRIETEAMSYFYVIHNLYNSGTPPYTLAEKESYKERFIRMIEKYKVTWTSADVIRAW